MTIGSSMSSGYCSLDEDLEDCFFTAKTSFFRSAQSKVPAKVTRGAGPGMRLPHVRLRALPKTSPAGAQGREGVLPSPRRALHRCGFSSAFSTAGFPVPRGFTPDELSGGLFAALR